MSQRVPTNPGNRPASDPGLGGDLSTRLRVRRPPKMSTSLPLREIQLHSVPPPPLEPAEKVMEKGLAESLNWVYQGTLWYQRTWELSQIWDQVRRRRLGWLKSSFTEFQPRWMDRSWDDFNQARRQADAQGARYEDWVQAVFATTHAKDATPQRLHGDSAAKAFARYQPTMDIAAPRKTPGGPPLQEQVAQIVKMAENVYGDDPLAGAKLIKDSIEMGVLPKGALERLPRHLRMAYEQLADPLLSNQPRQTPAPVAPSPKMIV